jgi:hypothetical protein
MRSINRVIVHHSAGKTTETAAEVRRFHLSKGWNDIGYHWFLHRQPVGDALGRWVEGPWVLEQGRSEALAGAHDEGQNPDSIGVCIAGNYSRESVDPAGWIILVLTVVDICRRWGLTADQVEGHREHEPSSTPTACPGFDPERLRQAVRSRLQGEAEIGVSTGLRATM